MQINFTFNIVQLLCRLLKLNIIKTKAVKLDNIVGFNNKKWYLFPLFSVENKCFRPVRNNDG